jgi:signal peptidase I
MDQNSQTMRVGLRVFWLVVKFSAAALIIVIPIRLFLAQPFLVNGNSMAPTLMQNDYLVLDKLSYLLHTPQRGDVIIMRYPLDPSVYFVKRVIGLPGETVSAENGKITILSPAGTSTVLDEPYLVSSGKLEDSVTTLGSDEYFVLGDNRDQSSDSREWGPLQSKFIVGRAFVRLLPLNELQILPGQYRYFKE